MIQVVTHSARALGELKPAFRACPEAYPKLCKAVKDGRVSLYRLTSPDSDLIVAGERDGDTYFCGASLVAGCVRALSNFAKW